MDYRITFVYSDSSTRTQFAATHTDVENLIVHELRASVLNNKRPDFTLLTIHVSNITLTEPAQL